MAISCIESDETSTKSNRGGLMRRIQAAGIQEARARVQQGKDRGVCLDRGWFYDREKTKFMVVKLSGDQGIEVILDYGSDIRIASDIQPGSIVALILTGPYTGCWRKVSRQHLEYISPDEMRAEISKVRSLVKPLARKYGAKIGIRQGRGSMRGTILVQNLDHPYPEIPELRIEIAEALIKSGYESSMAMMDPSLTLRKNVIGLAKNWDHAQVSLSLVKSSPSIRAAAEKGDGGKVQTYGSGVPLPKPIMLMTEEW
jgi:hypothetical protein